VLFADGHISSVGNDVDQSVWRALGSRDGDELIDESF
jgi:hypothetical protein